MDTSKDELMVTIRCLAYNHEPYIRQCLDGFVMQKTNFRFEAIVHDDASTDGTAAIIKEYAEKYPDIIKPIFETENQYSKRDGSIRRIMNEHTHGKYVALCEGDDYWIDPLKLQKQFDFLERNPSHCMVFGAVLDLYPNGSTKEVHRYDCDIEDCSIKDCLRIGGGYAKVNSMMFNREKYGDGYESWAQNSTVGDFPMQLTMFLKGKVAYINNVWSCYRRSSGDNAWSIQILSNRKMQKEYTIQRHRLYKSFNKITNKKYSCIIFRKELQNLWNYLYITLLYYARLIRN